MQKADQQIGLKEPIEKYLNFVGVVVGQLVKAMNLPTDYYEDYHSAGVMGLLEAAQRFNPDLNNSFKRFAYPRVKGAIIDSVSEISGISPRAYRYGRAYKSFDDLVSEDREINCSDERAQLAKLLDLVSKCGLIFRMSIEEADESYIGQQQDRDRPDYQYQQYSSLCTIRELIEELPEIEREVLVKHYYEDMNFSEIADGSEKMSRSWVSRVHKRAINRLRQVYLKRIAFDS